MKTTCKPDRFGSGKNHQGIQVKNNVNKMGKRGWIVSRSHMVMKTSRTKNAETGVTSRRSTAGVCFWGTRVWFTKWRSGIPDLFAFLKNIIYPNYATHKVGRRLHSFSKDIRYWWIECKFWGEELPGRCTWQSPWFFCWSRTSWGEAGNRNLSAVLYLSRLISIPYLI